MAERKLQDTLAYSPRAFRLERAAAYLGISPSFFLKLVHKGTLPKPIKLRGATLWDRHQLDAAFDDLADKDGGNTMDRILGIKRKPIR